MDFHGKDVQCQQNDHPSQSVKEVSSECDVRGRVVRIMVAVALILRRLMLHVLLLVMLPAFSNQI